MNEFLEAFDGYAPYVTVIVVALLFRLALTRCVIALAIRIRRGAGFKMGPFEFGGGEAELIKSTTEATERGLVADKYGNPDNFTLLFKAVGPRLSKSTKAMQVPGGCLVLVSSELLNADGEWSASESLEFVPNVVIKRDQTVVNGFVLGSADATAAAAQAAGPAP